MIEISNLSIFYNKNKDIILKDIKLIIQKPSIVLIVGKSGSGKSTLAKALLGILQKFEKVSVSGSIKIDGKNINDINRSQFSNYFGFLPQNPMDYVLNLLVRDEISFPLENLGYSKEDINIKISEITQKLNIFHLLDKLVTEISSGELQKVALSTALITKPKILILDEPFARIDLKSTLVLLEILKSLKQENTYILIFEHHLDYLLEICDRVILLKNGKISIDGDPEQVVNNIDDLYLPEVSKILIPGISKKLFDFEDVFNRINKNLINQINLGK